MPLQVPENFRTSPAFNYVLSKGWKWKSDSTGTKLDVEVCPFCHKDKYHFGIAIHGAQDPQCNRDGLYNCLVCGKAGTLYQLKGELGQVNGSAIQSQKDWAGAEPDPLPDVDALHANLMADEDALDYLMNGRGFSRQIIEQQKLGLDPKHYFKDTGDVRALVYPYLVNGNAVYVHYRTLPNMPLGGPHPVPKHFNGPKGWEVPLYNAGALHEGIKSIIMVEGEANCIAAMDHGVTGICGVPGANFKKAEWIELLDKLNVERIYICYDKDKVGQKAAQALAARIGVERCWKITLPDFTALTDQGETRPGKDINEWFHQGGGTSDAFAQLCAEAVLFDVAGVASSRDAAQEFLDDMRTNGAEPRYKSRWGSLNKIVGFDEGDVIDILAPEKIGKTTFGMNLIEGMVQDYGEDGILICLEMTRARLARKWVAHKAQIADNIPKTAEEAAQLAAAFQDAVPRVQAETAARPGDLYFCLPHYSTTEDIYKLITDCIRRYGVKWIMLDNLQRLADTTPRGKSNRTEHLSEISKKLSQIAKEYNVQLVRILQPHRIQEGRMVTTDSVDGSSQVAKDCDCMITLHRNRVGTLTPDQFGATSYIEAETSFDSKMLATVGLSRYSSGGYATLEYDGARSTVREYNPAAIAKMQAELMTAAAGGSVMEQIKAAGTAAAAAHAPVAAEITI